MSVGRPCARACDGGHPQRAVRARAARRPRAPRGRGARARARQRRGGRDRGARSPGRRPNAASPARARSAAATAKITETPRSPTTSASCTSAGQGLTSPAGVHAKTVGSESATSTPAANASSNGRARAAAQDVDERRRRSPRSGTAPRRGARARGTRPRTPSGVKRWMTPGRSASPTMPAAVPHAAPRPNARQTSWAHPRWPPRAARGRPRRRIEIRGRRRQRERDAAEDGERERGVVPGVEARELGHERASATRRAASGALADFQGAQPDLVGATTRT